MGFIDHFDGSVLDASRWRTTLMGEGNSVALEDGKVVLSAANQGVAGISRNMDISGDFTVSVSMETQIGAGEVGAYGFSFLIVGVDNFGFAVFGDPSGNPAALRLVHLRFDADPISFGEIPLSPSNHGRAVMELNRSGNVLTCMADLLDGCGFRTLASFSVSPEPNPVRPAMTAMNGGISVIARLDDYSEDRMTSRLTGQIAPYAYPNLGCDLLLDQDGDLAIAVTGDLALTPNGRVCLLQDIADLLETLPGVLFGHSEYGAGIGRLFGESYKPGFVRHVERAVRDALINDHSVAPRLLSQTVKVDMEKFSDTELSVAIAASAISDGQIVPLNFVWQYGLDDVSRIFMREAVQ